MPRDEERPLPKPPSTPFERRKGFERRDEEVPLMADHIASAMANGTLDEFLRQEIPDNEHARKLAMMMMSMTGMLPAEDISTAKAKEPDRQSQTPAAGEPSQEMPSAVEPPEDVCQAVREGDVKGLMGLLAKEYNARVSGVEAFTAGEKTIHPSPDRTMIEKEIIDQLINIAAENSLSLDWLITRALTLYVQEYKKTGRL
jgi:hypothetical protein